AGTAAIQLVVEPAVHPGLTGTVVVPRRDALAEDVRVVPVEARDLLGHPLAETGHQVLIALVPQVVAMGERARHARAGDLDRVSADRFRVAWRQIAMPIDHRSFECGRHYLLTCMDSRYCTRCSILIRVKVSDGSKPLNTGPQTGISLVPWARTRSPP